MTLKRVFTGGEKAVYSVAKELADDLGIEVLPKFRVADAIEINNSGISNEAYSYALKAHFDVLIAKNSYPFLAIEFDGSGHDDSKDALKNWLCDRFDLPLVRVDMTHVNSKNFEDTAVGFFIMQLLCVDDFIENHQSEPYEIYDPMFFVEVPGIKRKWPFSYVNRYRNRLTKPFQQNLDLFGDDVRSTYEYGLINFPAIEGIWQRGNEYRAIAAQGIGNDKWVYGTDSLTLHVYGMSGYRRECYEHIWQFVMGLSAGVMYERALEFLAGDHTNIIDGGELKSVISAWKNQGFDLRVGLNLPL